MTDQLPPFQRGQRRRILGVCNQKGGAGKTTTTVSLGASLAMVGGRVRIHDMDPQDGSATFWLPPQWNDHDPDEHFEMADVLAGECSIDEATWPTTVPGLDIVPSTQTLTGWANNSPVGGDFALKTAMSKTEEHYDLEIIDCPPSLGQLTVASLSATEELMIPLRASGLDLAGVAELNRTLMLVRDRLNPELAVIAVILSGKLDSKLVTQILDRMRMDFPEAFVHEVRHTVRMGEAPLAHQPIHQFAPGCTADVDYQELRDRLFGKAVDAR